MRAKKSKYKVGVVIPTYNERKNIPILIKKILALGLNTKVIIVDDNSPDGTGNFLIFKQGLGKYVIILDYGRPTCFLK